MLGRMTTTRSLFQLVKPAERLGWTRFGSPGILGMPTSNPLCSPAYYLAGQDRSAAGCRANSSGPNRASQAISRPMAHGTRHRVTSASGASQVLAGAR